MSSHAPSSPNPCRYGYLYALQTFGSAPVALADLRHRKPKNLAYSPPAIGAHPNIYLYQVSRSAAEKALCGRNVQPQIQDFSYRQALSSDNIVVASADPLSPHAVEFSPGLLGDYLSHLQMVDPENGIRGFLERNQSPSARAHIVEAFGVTGVLDPMATDELTVMISALIGSPTPGTLSTQTTSFFADHVAGGMSKAYSISEIEELGGGRWELNRTEEDIEVALSTGVLSFEFSRSSDRFKVEAVISPDAADPRALPALVFYRPRGIADVVPLALNTTKDSERLIRDWAGAIPVVGDAAKAVISTAYHASNAPIRIKPLTAQATTHRTRDLVSFSLVSPDFSDLGSAMAELDRLSAEVGLPAEMRTHVRGRLLAAAASSSPRWRYQPFLVSEVLDAANHANFGIGLEDPVKIPQGAAHRQILQAVEAAAASYQGEDLSQMTETQFDQIAELIVDTHKRITGVDPPRVRIVDLTALERDDASTTTEFEAAASELSVDDVEREAVRS